MTRQKSKLLLLALLCVLWNAGTHGATPQGIILPWHFFGIAPELKADMAAILKEQQQRISKRFLRQATTLNELITRTGKVLPFGEQKQWAKSTYIGQLQQIATQNSLLFIPSLCHIDPYLLVSLSVLDLQSLRLLALQNKLSNYSFGDGKEENRGNIELRQMSTELLEVKLQPGRVSSHQRVRVLSRFPQNHSKARSGRCLDLIAEQTLLELGIDIFGVNGEIATYVRRLLNPAQERLRATRLLQLTWHFSRPLMDKNTQWPLVVAVSSHITDSIFGKRAVSMPRQKWSLRRDGSYDIRATAPEAWVKLIRSDQSSQMQNTKPRVVARNRAWVYLDKGRAWGLRIGDRLSTEDAQIKGHVIGYYGPEQNLSTPNGSPLYEGAILFIRKGQRRVRLDDAFDYDNTSYPTALPSSL